MTAPRRPAWLTVEEVEFLLGTDHPHNIAARLGYRRPTGLVQLLRRVGRPDLANRFERVA